jgi:hypothetical protein
MTSMHALRLLEYFRTRHDIEVDEFAGSLVGFTFTPVQFNVEESEKGIRTKCTSPSLVRVT